MKLTINRIYRENCTIGLLSFGGFEACSLELPYLNNKRSKSCIPAGLYPCRKYHSSKFGACIAIDNVVGRDHIRIHYGNYVEDSTGCVLIGDSLRIREGDTPWVANSKATMSKLMELLPDTFLMEIK